MLDKGKGVRYNNWVALRGAAVESRSGGGFFGLELEKSSGGQEKVLDKRRAVWYNNQAVAERAKDLR